LWWRLWWCGGCGWAGEAGRLRSTLTSELPWTLDNLREAHRRIESRRTIGKIVLTLEP
jgi:NADPH:quinone reductase-like Zn-dependent oxidoreductase